MDHTDLSQVKVVIWDLDDTYWCGTLTEGLIEVIPENRQAVLTLSQHGIINSICSNNDHDKVRSVLQAEGMWDYFVFPAINWGSKPEMILSTLEALQLRPENAVVVDDLARLRAQVTSAIPRLLGVLTPTQFHSILRLIFPPGLPPQDPGLHRLQQYKLLERKAAVKADLGLNSASINERFLWDSRIQCDLFVPDTNDIVRLHELITRSNQLNFTKVRLTSDEVGTLLSDSSHKCYGVRVRDRFGDYGISGFVAINSAGQLVQFLFSCRVLQMGIEDAVYKYLSRPPLIVAPGERDELSRSLAERSVTAPWVHVSTVQTRDVFSCETSLPVSPPPRPLRVAFIGDCGISAFSFSLARQSNNDPAIKMTNRVTSRTERSHLDFWAHRTVMEAWTQRSAQNDWANVIANVPWLGPDLLKQPFDAEIDVYVIGLMHDYFSAEYRHKKSGLLVPYYYFQMGCRDITRETAWPTLIMRSQHWAPVDIESARQFSNTFEFEGPATPEGEITYLERLLHALSPHSHLILVNAPEIVDWKRLDNPVDYVGLDDMVRQGYHHRTLNRAVEAFSNRHDRVHLVDVRRYVQTAGDARDLMHPTRERSLEIGRDLIESIAEINRSRAADASSIQRARDCLERCYATGDARLGTGMS